LVEHLHGLQFANQNRIQYSGFGLNYPE